ncbi:hypothetical protein CBR_g887 [Chara braunii]|uniref:Uncharacterized protein n=1 Tax=Chara braunii TaxID=69332 RepID=A0A388KCG7_CHABU|nr:hypothetical protein CBR_g887 [Chara braunii]|eukprot:GBG67762.1 hypothetical protein CBR_g887 [Chara braunii]
MVVLKATAAEVCGLWEGKGIDLTEVDTLLESVASLSVLGNLFPHTLSSRNAADEWLVVGLTIWLAGQVFRQRDGIS